MNILLDKAALCYQMGDLKKALECYDVALKVMERVMHVKVTDYLL